MKTALAILVVLVAIAANGSAAGPTRLTGDVYHASLSLRGPTTVEIPNMGSLHISGQAGEQARQKFILVADEVVINRTYETRLAVGTMPTTPDQPIWDHPTNEGSRETKVTGATILGSAEVEDLGILVLPRGPKSANASIQTDYGANGQPASKEVWQVGFSANRVNATPANQPLSNPMDRSHTTVPGLPAFATSFDTDVTISGTFTIHLWGPAIEVTAEQGRSAFRSGEWDENVTTARRDRYTQLIELRVLNGVLSLTQQEGITRVTGPDASTRTTGSVVFGPATGSLETTTETYVLNGEDLEIAGDVTQEISATESGLHSRVDAQQAHADLPASVTTKARRTTTSTWAWAVYVVLAAVVLPAAVWSYRRIAVSRDWTVMITNAQDALANRDWGRSFRLSEKLLYRKAPRPEWRVDPWFVHTACRMQLGDLEWVLREVPAEMANLGNPATLAYLLTLAAVKSGDMAAARKWGALFRKDPDVMRSFLNDPALAEMRAKLGYAFSGGSAGYA